jgi:hypothetical protein
MTDRIGYFKQYYDMHKDKIIERSRQQHIEKREKRLELMIEYNRKHKKYISYQDIMRGLTAEPPKLKPKFEVKKVYNFIVDLTD